jgi:hypothetical protein
LNFFFKKKFNLDLADEMYWRWKSFIIFNFDNTTIFPKFLKNIQFQYSLSFNPTSVIHNTNSLLKKTKIYFLRKNKIFNKSRYSRNRQLYRTGVYWCLWVAIFLGWGLYFVFYRFSLNFGYVWWLVYITVSLFFMIRALKYRYYNIIIIFKDFLENIKWAKFILLDLCENLNWAQFQKYLFDKKT